MANATPLSLGILAHVDAGKTTLSEALLYTTGAKRSFGRVDHKDTLLDSHDLERARGITIFSKQARLAAGNREIILIDTPGHVDFSPEAERTMGVLDCAILLISATDGVQAHSLTLWNLLKQYNVPTFLFINKTDLPGKSREEIIAQLQKQLDSGCLDFADTQFYENAAMCSDAMLESFLQTGEIPDSLLQEAFRQRKLFPCCFGSALKLEGVEQLLSCIETFAPTTETAEDFGAKVYKISRDAQGARLTWMKITGGSLKTRQPLSYQNQKGETLSEKAQQLRLYSGEKFTPAEEALPGQVCAVTGLSGTYAGQGLGSEPDAPQTLLQPVMTYRLLLPQGCDAAATLPKLRLLEEEEPQLHLYRDARSGSIHAQIMGKVQLEILKSLVKTRLGLEIDFDAGSIFYKETIDKAVEGVGHFEPLRHYAEVHLLLEPLPAGSGLVFDSVCSTDVLDIAYQKLILSHLSEKTHLGVLTGSPITDIKITLLIGKAHLKHTEGGDFREATYRAVRQGLMRAKSVLLEPWYALLLTLPSHQVGRAITDIRAMGGKSEPPETEGDTATLHALVPASELKDYAQEVAAYTQGLGQLQVRFHSYAPCHNTEAVIEAIGYNPEADLENTPDSVFCAHGAGFTVKWNQVPEYMHLEGYKESKPYTPEIITKNLLLDDKELEAILQRQFATQRLYRPEKPKNMPAEAPIAIAKPRQNAIIVDGYNIIFAWDELAQTAKSDLEAARRQLLDRLSSYAGFRKCYMVVVFDGHKVKGNLGEKLQYHNIGVVYTRENETADSYIEALASQIGPNYAVRVATSDALVQLGSFRSGVLRMSARELKETLELAEKEMRGHF